MNCANHNKKATNICSICNKALCEECALTINEKIFCKECLLNNSCKSLKTSAKLHCKSQFMVFLLSFFPGIVQMYLGYIKRGLILLALGILMFKINALELLLLLMAFSFFDGFKLNNDLRLNIYHEDNLKDIFQFIKNNKFFLAILLILLFISFANNARYFLFDIFDFLSDIFENIFDFLSDIFDLFWFL